MRRNILLVQFVGVLLLLPSIMSGQQHSSDNKNWAEKGIVIREVEILGKRPMKDIGVQQTRFDSLVLKENIALSMADILTFNSSIFVKSYGRATLSTVSFRGTSASHTQVTWNGMRINNPMLGMTDFSMIPSYFIDAWHFIGEYGWWWFGRIGEIIYSACSSRRLRNAICSRYRFI